MKNVAIKGEGATVGERGGLGVPVAGAASQARGPAAVRTGAEPGRARMYYLDYLRAGVVALVMLHHTAITYGALGSWYYLDPTKSKYVVGLLSWFTAWDQAWFMGFLFFLSGYLSLPSYTRKGAGRYVADRLRRFGIPLLVYVFAISPVVTWLSLTGHPGVRPSLLMFWRTQYLTLRIVDLGPLWFVWALLLMDLLLVVWARTMTRQDLGARQGGAFPGRGRLVVFALGLGLASFAVRQVMPVGQVLWGLQIGYFPGYVAMFILGLQAWRHRWLGAIPDSAFRLARRWAIAGTLIFPFILVIGGALTATNPSTAFAGGLHWQALAYALWEPWVLVGMSIMLVHWAQRRLDRPSARWQGWAGASYVAYIIQPLVLVPLSLLFRHSPWPALAKFTLVGAGTVVLVYAAARVVRLIPRVRTALG